MRRRQLKSLVEVHGQQEGLVGVRLMLPAAALDRVVSGCKIAVGLTAGSPTGRP